MTSPFTSNTIHKHMFVSSIFAVAGDIPASDTIQFFTENPIDIYPKYFYNKFNNLT